MVLANGAAGPVAEADLAAALREVCLDLTLQLARDGEGATKLLTVTVRAAADASQARRVAKAIVNSPLVKTAVHGADPNWGRVAMAIGKCQDDLDIDPERVVIRFGDLETYPAGPTESGLRRLTRHHGGRPRRDRGGARHRPRRGDGLRLRPVGRLRPHQRRLHHLSDRLDATDELAGSPAEHAAEQIPESFDRSRGVAPAGR